MISRQISENRLLGAGEDDDQAIGAASMLGFAQGDLEAVEGKGP